MSVYGKKKKRSPDSWIRFRIITVGVVLGFGFVVIVARTAQLQVLERGVLLERAESQYKTAFHKTARRGTIYDSNHQELAVSIDVASVYADPKKISAPRAVAGSLSRALGIDKAALFKNFRSEKSFVWIKRQLTPHEVDSVKALAVDGIDFISERRRYYPMKTLASQVIGFCDLDGRGIEGLEYYYDPFLSGRKGSWTVFKDALGRSFKVEEPYAAIEDGQNIVLTIDANIQHIAEKALTDTVRTFAAKSGIAIVMEPATGAVKAIAHAPQYNHNTFAQYEPWMRRNRAITDSFEPGSTFKIFLAASALESGLCKVNSQFDCEDGRYQVGRNVIHDVHPYGFLSFQDVLKYSSNIGAAKIGAKIGPAYYYHRLRDFGFGEHTGIDSPGETAGAILPLENWTDMDAYAACFGQGVSVSALQLASAVSVTANDGVLMKPYLVKALTDRQGNIVKTFSPTRVRRVISSEAANKIAYTLERVVAKGGTGQKAALKGYRVAGKTGTAQKVAPGAKEYAKDKYVAAFVGFVPAQDPAIVVLVVIDEPQKNHYGGVVAAPVFRQIAEEALQYLKIPPDLVVPNEQKAITTAMEGSWMG